MIDLLNLIVSVIAAFILGLSMHSTYLHQKEKYGWKFQWDHDEVSRTYYAGIDLGAGDAVITIIECFPDGGGYRVLPTYERKHEWYDIIAEYVGELKMSGLTEGSVQLK